MQNTFELKLLRSHWINDDGLNYFNDLCSYGVLHLQIGEEILSDINTAAWCTTVAGLHLMRSLFSDYAPGNYSAQLIPCCGHEMYYSEDGTKVEIFGCPVGIDFNIIHKKNYVELITASGTTVTIETYYFINTILTFANDVEAFYGNPDDKILPDDKFTADTFKLFWTEWNELRVKSNCKN